MKKYLAILQTGQPIKQALDKYGDFDELFINAMNIDKSLTKTIRIYDGVEFPDPQELVGIIITGSPAMVTEGNDWCIETQKWLEQFVETDIPILGVCYGHQLLAKLLGGTVDWNPKGREMGQITMQLTPDARKDKLLSSIVSKTNNSIKFQATHQQSVICLPEKVTLLGSTNLDPHHCFCYKNHLWGLQFHPEFSLEVIKDYIALRSEDIIKEGLNPKKMIANLAEEDNGLRLLLRFKQICFPKVTKA